MRYSEIYSFKDLYPKISNEDGWGIDIRHVYILYNILLSCSFKRVLEIGTHNGFSTTAFIEATKRNAIDEIHLCDICFSEHIKDICSIYSNIELHEMKSVEYLKNAPQFDFVLLDGSHISEDVQDEFEYLSMNKTSTYLLHDVNTQLLPESKETPWYDGPMLLKNRLLSSDKWFCIEDSLFRDYEKTERGLFFATKDRQKYLQALSCFNYWRKANLEITLKDNN